MTKPNGKKHGGARPGSGRKRGSSNVRSQQEVWVTELAREHGPDAVKFLTDTIDNAKAPYASRVAAANSILERAYGKAPLEIRTRGQVDVTHRYETLEEAQAALRETGIVIDHIYEPLGLPAPGETIMLARTVKIKTAEHTQQVGKVAYAQVRGDFWAFRQYLDPGMMKGWWQREIAMALHQFYLDFIAGKRSKLAIFSPRQQ